MKGSQGESQVEGQRGINPAWDKVGLTECRPDQVMDEVSPTVLVFIAEHKELAHSFHSQHSYSYSTLATHALKVCQCGSLPDATHQHTNQHRVTCIKHAWIYCTQSAELRQRSHIHRSSSSSTHTESKQSWRPCVGPDQVSLASRQCPFCDSSPVSHYTQCLVEPFLSR